MRREGEVIRLKQAVELMKGQLDSLATALTLDGPLGADIAQGILITSSAIIMSIAKHDAFLLAEDDKNPARRKAE